MVNCRIRYLAGSIQLDFEPICCANFKDWLKLKVPMNRWQQIGNRWGCEVSEDEAIYIEKIAISQWGPQGCEVLGKPVSNVEPKPAKNEQLGLF
jgi:hypothetical protein